MFGPLDRLIARLFRYLLHKRRDEDVKTAENNYLAIHEPLGDEQKKKITKLLNTEINRVYAIADHSITNARILQARYTFWLTAIVLTLTALGINFYLVPLRWPSLLLPPISALISWIATLITIPANFNERVIGGLDSALYLYDESQKEKVQQTLSMRLIMENMPIAVVVEKLEKSIDAQYSQLQEIKQRIINNSNIIVDSEENGDITIQFEDGIELATIKNLNLDRRM